VAFSNDGQTLYVTNFAFTQFVPACNPPPAPPPNCTPANPGAPPSIDSAWTAVVNPPPPATNPRSTVVKFERIVGFTPPTFP